MVAEPAKPGEGLADRLGFARGLVATIAIKPTYYHSCSKSFFPRLELAFIAILPATTPHFSSTAVSNKNLVEKKTHPVKMVRQKPIVTIFVVCRRLT